MEITNSQPDDQIDLQYAMAALLFSESNTRFVVEVEPDNMGEFSKAMSGVDIQWIGSVIEEPKLTIEMARNVVVESDLATLKSAWQGTLDWS